MSLNFSHGQKIANEYNNKNKIVKSIYYLDDDDDNNKILDKIRLNNKTTSFFPNISDFKESEQVDRIYVCGETGCGKSTFIKEYVLKFIDKYSKSPILLFSSKLEDKALDSIKKINRVDINDDIHINPFTLKEISSNGCPTLCIFDDCEDFSNKKITNEVSRLRDEILRNGRSYGIFSIYVHHNPSDYKSTRNQIFEANKIVIFPKRSGQGTYNYLLEKKLFLQKDTVNLINSLKSNFVCINKQIPKCIISDKYIILL